MSLVSLRLQAHSRYSSAPLRLSYRLSRVIEQNATKSQRVLLETTPLGRRELANYLLSAAETKHQVEGRLLLDVVVRQSAAILKLLAGEDQTLLVRGDALFVLDLLLHAVESSASRRRSCPTAPRPG
ncbi:unnamed protein product [Ectocarpus fasciculatus]